MCEHERKRDMRLFDFFDALAMSAWARGQYALSDQLRSVAFEVSPYFNVEEDDASERRGIDRESGEGFAKQAQSENVDRGTVCERVGADTTGIRPLAVLQAMRGRLAGIYEELSLTG